MAPKMRGVRYLKCRRRALSAGTFSEETLSAFAVGASAGDLRYESRTHPSTAPYAVASMLPVMPRLALPRPVAGTGLGWLQSVGTACPPRGHGERTGARMNIFERRTANRAFYLSIALKTMTLDTSSAPFTSGFRSTDTKCNHGVTKDNTGTFDSDNRESR